MTLYETLGGVAFLLIVCAHALAVLALRREQVETNSQNTPDPASKDQVPAQSIPRHGETSRTMPAHHLRDYLRPVG
jgi:hypothetical protein